MRATESRRGEMLTPQAVSRFLNGLGREFLNHAAQGIGSSTRERCRQPAGLGPAHVNQEWAMRRLIKLLRCQKGASAIEYALVAGLIAIAAVGAFDSLGNKIDTMYNNVSNHL
jgi:pilus assembly protein Flp/PilA